MMDVSPSPSASRPQTLTLITSSPCFLPLPPPPTGARRHGRAGGALLLLRPRRKPELGPRAHLPSCLWSCPAASLQDGSVAVAAAAAVLAALQLALVGWGRREHSSAVVLNAQDTSIVNEALACTEKLRYDSNFTSGTTHVNGFSEPNVSQRKAVDVSDNQAGVFSCVDTVHDTIRSGCIIPHWTCLNTSADIPGLEHRGSSSSTTITSSVDKDTTILEMMHSVPEGQHGTKSLSSMPGRVAALPHLFVSLSARKELAENGQGPSHNHQKVDDANLLGRQYYDEEEHLDLTSLSSFKNFREKPIHFSLQANVGNLFEQRQAIKVANSHVGGSYFTAGQLVPVACLREGSTSNRKKAVKDHDVAKVIGWSISESMNKESPDSFAAPNNVGVKGTKDPSEYLRRYSSLLMDGRLKDCVDLLESMEKKGLLDMNKIHHASFLTACKKQRAVTEAVRFCKLIDNPKMSTFNMLLSVCASSQDFDGALQVMLLLKEAGLKPDCKLYTTLISTCAKCGKVDAMFEVFHEMVSAGIEPNVNTYGALIDGCAKAGQVAKAFGAYGIMSSKKVKPDRVVFNALISACGESGAVARAFDVLADMTSEASESKASKPIFPDHVTVGALMKTCIQAGQADRACEVYKMLEQYNIKGTSEVYTIALRSCSLTGDLGFALKIYEDMNKNGVNPDEMFLSALIDVAGHAKRADAAFEIMKDARAKGLQVGTMTYSSLMGACCNAKDWKKALELFEEIKSIKLTPTVSMMNALITSLCDGDQISKSVEVLDEMNKLGVRPNEITYSVIFVACEKNAEAQLGLELFEQLKKDGVPLNPTILGCLTGLCLQMFENDLSLGNIIVRFNSGKPQIDNKWTSSAITVYRKAISAGLLPSSDVLSQVLGCLRFPHGSSLSNTFIENMGISCDISKHPNISSLLEGFGEYDIRAFSILEEAASLGVVASTSIKDGPIVVDARKLRIYTAEVSLLTTLRCLKYRLAAGAKLPNVTILLPTEKTQVDLDERERTIKLAGRVGQAVGALWRRLGISYQGEESHGKVRINGLTLRRWFNPKLTSTSSAGTPADMLSLPSRLAKGIANQQRHIRNLSLE